ncbi:MAG TPA: histidine kinase [Gaiellaceae bacterium]|nr:histidine kinase [Gaiellaceae bacterium]
MATAVPSEFVPAERGRVWSPVPAAAAVAVAAAAAGVGFALAAGSPDPVQVFLLEWVAVPYVAAGVIAWWCRPQSRLGPLMVAGGLASALSGWQLAEASGPYTLGVAFDIVPAALFLHVCLAFPDGRLRTRFERILVGVAYASAVGLQLVKLLLGGVDPANLIDVWRQPGVVATVEDVQLLSLSACCLVGLGVLAGRRRRSGAPRRASLAIVIDSFAIALVMIAALFLIATFGWPGFHEVQRVTLFVVGLSPLAFLLGLLDARLARSAVGDLILELHADPAPGDLRDALATALRDPSLALAYWLPDFQTYVDVHGRPVRLPDDERRAATLIERDGEPVAALVHDAALGDERQLLEAVGAAAGMSLENARLEAELRARVEELRGSRARLIEAGQKERQRLERNLHDGAQQRLIALSLRLRLLEKRLPDAPEARQELDAARREIALSLEELRDVARGIHPAVLTGHGLAVAVESLSARAPLPVRLTMHFDGRLPEPVEVAAYYVVSESLANVAKHAQASEARVSLDRQDGLLVVEVVDDGVGGADTERGSGLRGLADRVEALGGRIRVWTPVGGGTRVQAEIPCA